MDIWKSNQSFASSFSNKHGEGHLQKVMGNSENADNRLLFCSSILSTPIKTSGGTQGQIQTPTSRLGFLSAKKQDAQQPTSPCLKASDNAIIARTPLGLLAANKMTPSFFSPSPCQLLGSPALTGRPRRVFVMPPELLLTPARRVPVKHKSSKAVGRIRQSPSFTPKGPTCATPYSNRTNPVLESSCRTDDRHHHDALRRRVEMEIAELPRRVPSCTRLRTPLSTSSRVDHVGAVICQKPDGNIMEHHDGYLNTIGKSVLPKRMLAFTHSQSACATQISSRKDPAACANDSQVPVAISKQHCSPALRIDDVKPDTLALFKRLLASSPYLSTPARVPVRQKPSKDTSPQCFKKKKKQCVSSCKSLKTRTLGQAKVQARGKASDTRKENTEQGKLKSGVGADDGGVCELKQHCEGQESTENIAQQCSDGVHEMSGNDSKKHDDRGIISTESAADLSATRSVKHLHIKNNGCAVVAPCKGNKPSKRMSSLDTPTSAKHLHIKNTGSAVVAPCKGNKPSKKMPSFDDPTGSVQVKQGKEKKLCKKTSSMEAPIACKAGQAQKQNCHNAGKTVDARRKNKDKLKESLVDTGDNLRNRGMNKAKKYCKDVGDTSRKKSMGKAKQQSTDACDDAKSHVERP